MLLFSAVICHITAVGDGLMVHTFILYICSKVQHGARAVFLKVVQWSLTLSLLLLSIGEGTLVSYVHL